MIDKGLINNNILINIKHSWISKRKALKSQEANRQNTWAQIKHTKTQLFNTLKEKCSVLPVIKESHIITRVKQHSILNVSNIYFLKYFFKVFIELVTILLLFYLLVFWPRGMWDLSSPTRDWPRTPCPALEGKVLTTGPRGKSPNIFLN